MKAIILLLEGLCICLIACSKPCPNHKEGCIVGSITSCPVINMEIKQASLPKRTARILISFPEFTDTIWIKFGENKSETHFSGSEGNTLESAIHFYISGSNNRNTYKTMFYDEMNELIRLDSIIINYRSQIPKF